MGELRDLGLEIVKYRQTKKSDTAWHNLSEKLLLVVTEICEAVEEHRRLKTDEHGRPLDPQWAAFRMELSDGQIRVFDIAYTLGIDIEARMQRKLTSDRMMTVRGGRSKVAELASIPTALMDLTKLVCHADDVFQEQLAFHLDDKNAFENFAGAIVGVSESYFDISESLGFSLVAEMKKKMLKNWKREERHGGKNY